MRRGTPRKHIVSARIKPPYESKGFSHHLWRAIKRTFLNVIIVIILFALLFFTDGFWMCTSPITLTPIDLSGVKKVTKEKEIPNLMDPSTRENSELMFVDHLYENVVSGPESFVFYGNSIITTCADGKVMMLKPNNESSDLYSRCDKPDTEKVCGRPLGIELVDNRTLFFVDSYHGLFSLDLETQKQTRLFPKPEDSDFDILNSTYRFLNSLQVDDQSIYFTLSSDHNNREDFVNAFMEPDCTGRIIKLDRKSLEHSTVLSNLCFPNGLSTDTGDENYLIVSELSYARVLRVNKHSGEYTVFADGLPGFPDNIRTDGKGYWVGFSGVRFSAFANLIYERAFIRVVTKYLNTMHILNPVNMVPPYGLVGYIDQKGTLTKLLHDPSGQGAQKISEAAPHGGYLYIGSYHPKFKWVSRYKLKN